MNLAIVWVMLVQTGSGALVPTIEFKTEKACLVASLQIMAEGNKHTILGRKAQQPICLKIEK